MMLSLLSRCRQVRREQDSGVTLIELLVSMTIFGIVIAAAYGALFMVQKQTADTMARGDAVQQAKLAVATIDRQVRSGNVLYDPAQEAALGYPMSMRIYTQANGVEKCVQWQITGGQLRMRSWSPTWQTDHLVGGWSTVARDVVNKTTDPVAPFTLPSGASTFSVRTINVLLHVKNAASGGRPYDVSTTLAGRNTIYGYDTSTCSPIPS